MRCISVNHSTSSILSDVILLFNYKTRVPGRSDSHASTKVIQIISQSFQIYSHQSKSCKNEFHPFPEPNNNKSLHCRTLKLINLGCYLNNIFFYFKSIILIETKFEKIILYFKTSYSGTTFFLNIIRHLKTVLATRFSRILHDADL